MKVRLRWIRSLRPCHNHDTTKGKRGLLEAQVVDRHTPPGWPDEVLPPHAPDWERTAIAWLYDVCPPEYRAYEVLRRHPIVLARFAGEHVESTVEAARQGLRTLRRDLLELVGPDVVDAALAAFDREGRRLVVTGGQVALVAAALRGERHVPRL